ncbi:hypothetical protein B0H13DRAFT_1644834, partial [Mycena leptocephala]
MKSFTLVSILALATYVSALPFDPSGAGNVGNGIGQQFAGGQCLSAADCGSGCCAGPSGICTDTLAGTTSCGFVAGGPTFDPAGAGNVGNGEGEQFAGGQCLSAADCESGCCAGPSGICSEVGSQTRAGKTGCGF